MRLIPAPPSPDWLRHVVGGTNAMHHYAVRCLPLMIANESGWLLLNRDRFFAVWNGGTRADDLTLVYQASEPSHMAQSHFGYGIVTWTIPYVFRTPPGYNLLVRGPANRPKDGASPLEGVVETDWAEASFTMSWKLTRPNTPVIFGADEPICMIVPQKRGELESFHPEILDISQEPELQAGHVAWHASRKQFVEEQAQADSEAARRGWQRDYFKGVTVGGRLAPEHQRKVHLRPFVDQSSDGPT